MLLNHVLSKIRIMSFTEYSSNNSLFHDSLTFLTPSRLLSSTNDLLAWLSWVALDNKTDKTPSIDWNCVSIKSQIYRKQNLFLDCITKRNEV